ncbi:hypothetical protein TNCV_1381511 [Trichonephila clavipes]|nr:hypothetical protein TNCV_1381511 [Trichonephila clavipes]
MGKKGDLAPCKKAEVKAFVNAKLFSNLETLRRLKVFEASVRLIKKKIESGPAARQEAQVNSCNESKASKLAKQWRDKDVNFWRSLEEWFPNGEPYIFMQDGAPCHAAPSIKSFLAEQNIPLLDWPCNSPDMNPNRKRLGVNEKKSG